MKSRLFVIIIAALVGGLPMASGAASKGASDITPPTKRQATIVAAERLTRPPTPAPLPDDLRHPFNPPEFNPAPVKKPADPTKPDAAPRETQGPTDRELLETLASRIPNAATMIVGTKPYLIVGAKRLEVGSEFVVGYNGQDYELTLTAIDRTTFTLRYRGEETTRPLRIVK